MTLNELMAQLAKANVKLSARDGELSVSAAKGALTAELTTQLRAFKQDIIALLAPPEAKAQASEIVPDTEHRYEPFPFSDLQVGFYMADDPYMEYHVRPHYYCETDVIGLDVQRYEVALNKAWERHRGEMVLVCGDRQLQALSDAAPLKVRVNDWRALPASQATLQMLDLRERVKREEQPLDRWPWFDLQVSLWRDGGVERARIHFNHNNFYSDGYGAMVLQREIDRFYADPALPVVPLKLSFRDAVLGLQALSVSPAGDRARKYWIDRLADLPEPPSLSQLQGVNRRCRSRLQRREGTLSAEAWQQFKTHAARFGLTPTSAVITAYAEILGAWSGQQHFILSNMVTRRLPLHPDIGEMIGNFASLYPLEVDLRGGQGFATKAQRMQQQILRDSDHREWGGMQVMQAFNRLKGEFGVVPCPFVVGSGLFLEGFRKADFSCLETAQTIFDHQFWEIEGGSYYYVWDLLEEFFPAGMIDQMWLAFGRLLESLAAGPEAWEQVRMVLAPPARPALDAPVAVRARQPVLLHDALRERAESTPQSTVFRNADGCMSYCDLDARADAVAAILAGHAVVPNELVALVMDRGAPLMAAALGILRAGAAYVPIDPKLPQERMRYMLDNSAARVVLTESHYRDRLDWPSGVAVIEIGEQLCEEPGVPAPQGLQHAHDLAYVIYTSGSTGNPKGVMIDHRAALNTVVDINDRFGVSADDVVLGVSSFSFDLSVYDLFGVLDAGATLVYPDPAAALNPAHWLDLMVKEGVTVWNSAPPLMSLLAETAQRQGTTLPALRLVMLSGDWIPVELPAAIRAIAPNAAIVSLGGATEAAIWSIYYPVDSVDPTWSSIPYGRALSGQGWQVRDAQGRQCPTWTTGDLYITGIGLAQGYWADPVKTAASFIVDPVSGERLYRTGDRGRFMGDGNIEFMGRADSQVKVQGHRIELGEVEATLNSHPDVKEGVVLALPVNLAPGAVAKPNHPKHLVAYVVWMDGAIDSGRSQMARDFLGLKLPAHMVPAAWVMLERMPISHNGKLDRSALAKVLPADAAGTGAGRRHVAPRGDVEQRLAAIWEGVLRRDGIGAQDDFFELGGQSFDAVRCVALIQEAFGRSLSLGDIWQSRTIEKLAQRLGDQHAGSADQRLVDIDTGKAGRPLFFVHPAGGQVTGYYSLAGKLQRPSYGLVALEQDAASDSLATIELIAARYVSQLRQVQAHGPYTIAGWSSGGCIAYEMALQIERMGERVDHLYLIDCPAPLVHERLAEGDMLRGFIEDLDLHLPMPSRDADGVLEGRALYDALFAQLQAQSDKPIGAAELYPFYRVFRKVVDAVRSYRPGRLGDAPCLHVVRAADGEVSEFAGHPFGSHADWGWSELTAAAIDTVALPGTHHTLLQGVHVDAVAAVFARAVNTIAAADNAA